jgi:hypothetical protein
MSASPRAQAEAAAGAACTALAAHLCATEPQRRAPLYYVAFASRLQALDAVATPPALSRFEDTSQALHLGQWVFERADRYAALDAALAPQFMLVVDVLYGFADASSSSLEHGLLCVRCAWLADASTGACLESNVQSLRVAAPAAPPDVVQRCAQAVRQLRAALPPPDGGVHYCRVNAQEQQDHRYVPAEMLDVVFGEHADGMRAEMAAAAAAATKPDMFALWIEYEPTEWAEFGLFSSAATDAPQ